MSSTGESTRSSIASGERATEHCFYCDRPQSEVGLVYFTCPACPGPNQGGDIGVGRYLLCHDCLDSTACRFCERRPTTDDVVPDGDTPREDTVEQDSSGGTGASGDHVSSSRMSTRQLQMHLQQMQNTQRRVQELEEQVQALSSDRSDAKQLPVFAEGNLKVEFRCSESEFARIIWCPRTFSVDDALNEIKISPSSGWAATYDGAELRGSTILQHIVSGTELQQKLRLDLIKPMTIS